MIIFELFGGLGNQLFIYAFARSLSHDLDQELYLDISRYNFNIYIEHVIYGLHPYNIKGVVGNYPSDLYSENRNFKGKLNVYEYGIPLTFYSLYKKGHLESNLDKIKYPAYFTGYYSAGLDENNIKVITEKFFIHNEDIIREDLKYLPEIDSEYQDLVDDIKNSNAIAIHIRRGEYKDLDRFGTCSVNYYQEAIKKISSMVENPKFFIFTEDHEWVKENIDIPFPHRHVVFERKKHSLAGGYAELLKIHSLCDHFIIANSTFSWWGAWLSENKDKIIIAPEPWYQSREILYTETISNKKPILIENNYKEVYDKSENILFNLNDFIEGTFSSSNKNVKITNNELKIDNSTIFIPKLHKNEDNPLMLKLIMETNSNDNLTVIYRSKQEKLKYYQLRNKELKYEDPFKVYYYKNDKFEQYIKLPANVELDNISIKFANNNNSQFLVKSLEIKEIENEKDTRVLETIEKNEKSENIDKFNKYNRAIQNKDVNSVFSKFIKARVDIKNTGNSNNSLVIKDSDNHVKESFPPWWTNHEGKGVILRSTAGNMSFKVQCINGGKLRVFLRAEDVRDNNNQRIPIYLKYTKLRINNEDVLKKDTYVHHDGPFYYEKEVKDSELVDVYVEWEPI